MKAIFHCRRDFHHCRRLRRWLACRIQGRAGPGHVRIDTRATLPVPAPPVEIVERVRSLYFPLWDFFRSSYVNFRRQEA